MEYQQPMKMEQEKIICRTPCIFREEPRKVSISKGKKLSRRKRFWRKQGTNGRVSRRWASRDVLSAKRCLFPRQVFDDQEEEEDKESDLSGYSLDWCTDSECDADDMTCFAGDINDYVSPIRCGSVYVSENAQDCFDYELRVREMPPVREPSVEPSVEPDENVNGVIINDEPMPVMQEDYPYADDCPLEMSVAYEVEVVSYE